MVGKIVEDESLMSSGSSSELNMSSVRIFREQHKIETFDNK
jgi:hypothetical protein